MDINDITYVHIPKTGGQSIQSSLKELNYVNRFGHATANEIRGFIGEEKFNDKFLFTVVRNPWDKILSIYNFVTFGSDLITNTRDLPEFKDFKALNITSFENFIDVLYYNFKSTNKIFITHRPNIFYLTMEHNYELVSNTNQMVRHQYDFIYDNNGTKLVNYVGYLDKLEESIEDIFNLTNVRIPPPKMKNVSIGVRKKINVSNRYVDMISEMYYKDIKTFNFKYEL